jgi:hypothetical protein
MEKEKIKVLLAEDDRNLGNISKPRDMRPNYA